MANNPLTWYRPSAVMARSPFADFQKQMNRLMEDAFGDFGSFPSVPEEVRGVLSPKIELTDGEREYRVTAEMPGVEEKDIEVHLDGDLLTLKAEKKAEKKEDKDNTHFTERSFGMFERSLRLPFQPDAGGVSAGFEKGVLTIVVPKPPGGEQKRRIEVKGAG